MSKKLVYVIAAVLGLSACDKTAKMETTKTGLRYMFHEGDTTGKKGKPGDLLTLKIAIKNHKDSVLQSTAQAPGQTAQLPIQPAPYPGNWQEGLAFVSEGDSVTFYESVDTLAKKFPQQPLPPFLPKGTDIKYTIKVVKVQTQAEVTKERDALAAKQKETDAKAIADYVAKNKLANVQKTSSGLNYIISDPGNGQQAQPSDSVWVHYTLKTLDGKVLESSKSNPDPRASKGFGFPLGVGAVIPGWDEGLTLFKKGGKGTLIVPSGLAYGPEARGPNMPANSILVFDIELTDVKSRQQ